MHNGKSHLWIRRQEASARHRVGAGLALALLITLMTVGSAAQQDGPGLPVKPFGGHQPISDCKQACLDAYFSNVARCRDIFCNTILFITFGCDEPGLAPCMSKVEDLFDDCIDACRS